MSLPKNPTKEQVRAALDAFFEPSVTLTYWPKRRRYSLGKITEFPLFKQFRKEAGIDGSITDENFDRFALAASNHGYSVGVEDARSLSL
jgi:hypothetical protein